MEGAIENPVTGEYVVVSYKYSANEPGSGGGEEETFDKIGDVITAGPGNYKVKGTVIATYKNGFLVSDGTASILVYLEESLQIMQSEILLPLKERQPSLAA